MGRVNAGHFLIVHIVQSASQAWSARQPSYTFLLCLQAELCPWEELHRMDTLLAQEEERRIETESILQCANLEIESLQAKVEAAGRAQSEQQSKVSLQLECARQVCMWFLCLPASIHHHQHCCEAPVRGWVD